MNYDDGRSIPLTEEDLPEKISCFETMLRSLTASHLAMLMILRSEGIINDNDFDRKFRLLARIIKQKNYLYESFTDIEDEYQRRKIKKERDNE